VAVPSRITLERSPDRPAWEARVEGTLVGLVWRERGGYRAVREGTSTPLSSRFSSRGAAARALARQAGHSDLDPRIIEVGTRGPSPRSG
jgi:hypothetical protein